MGCVFQLLFEHREECFWGALSIEKTLKEEVIFFVVGTP
jgi:hypothetical protein